METQAPPTQSTTLQTSAYPALKSVNAGNAAITDPTECAPPLPTWMDGFECTDDKDYGYAS